MAFSAVQFRLSATLAGHAADVRALATAPAPFAPSSSSSGGPSTSPYSAARPVLFSASRDSTARSWLCAGGAGSGGGQGDAPSGGAVWTEGLTFGGAAGHEGFVNAVEWAPGGGDDAAGFLVTAGQDKLIHAWPLPSPSASSDPSTSAALAPSHTLIGHSANVCVLHVSKDGKTIVSGSWDKTAKVWKNFQLEYTLEGHEQSVWAVLALEGVDDLYLTGSFPPALHTRCLAHELLAGAADNLIRLFRGSTLQRTFKGHTQAVRALAKLDTSAGGGEGGELFASGSNDGSIRLWSLLTGDCVKVLNGHDSFVYSLAAIPDHLGGGLISGGEDRTVRVWRANDGECEQTIVVPAVSVWCVSVLANGDIAAGASDGLVRVFTKEEERVASLEELAGGPDSSQIGDLKKSDLPGVEALDEPGKREGAVKVVKTWSAASRSWQKVGEVTDAVGSSRKQLYQGREYDYVFDIDLGGGAPMLKLPYNASDNPYAAAQQFLFANELPLSYIDEIANFIDKNTGGVKLGATGNVDPYTGASSYRGTDGAAPARGGPGGFGGDPFTGEFEVHVFSRKIMLNGLFYRWRTNSSTSFRARPPFRGHPSSRKSQMLFFEADRRANHDPFNLQRAFLTFTSANLPALRAKLSQLNDHLSASPSTSSLALSPADFANLDKLIAFLLVSIASPGQPASIPAPLGDAESAIADKLLSWPPESRFPGLDLIRLLSLSSPTPASFPVLLSTATDPNEREINSMLALRACANLFVNVIGKATMQGEADEVVGMLRARGVGGLNKNGKVAMATLALNFSVLAVQKSLDAKAAEGLAEIAVEVALALFPSLSFALDSRPALQLLKDSDSEVVYRSMVALGNLLVSFDTAAALPASASERYKAAAKEAAQRVPEARIRALAAEFQ
ncbi:SPOSA6832_01481, partial [Sporobolomyces salmonicolor]